MGKTRQLLGSCRFCLLPRFFLSATWFRQWKEPCCGVCGNQSDPPCVPVRKEKGRGKVRYSNDRS